MASDLPRMLSFGPSATIRVLVQASLTILLLTLFLRVLVLENGLKAPLLVGDPQVFATTALCRAWRVIVPNGWFSSHVRVGGRRTNGCLWETPINVWTA